MNHSLFFLIIPLTLFACGGDNNTATQPAQTNSTKTIYPAQNTDTFSAGINWELVWSDEFDKPELDLSKWTSQVILKPFNEEWQDYNGDPENAYIDNGHLVIKAIHHGNEHKPRNYTSARLNTAKKDSWKYGKFAARIQLPYGPGVWPAFWMLGDNIDENGGDTPWPESGEIDIFELYGSKDDAVIEANIHYDVDGHKQMGARHFKLTQGKFADNFHVFELEWNSTSMTWRVDGETFHTTAIDEKNMNEFHQKFFILLNLAVGGANSGSPDETTSFPALMYVDWVRIYQQK